MRKIFLLAEGAFRLLPRKFHRDAIRNIVFLIAQSGIEILSALALLPLFYKLGGTPSGDLDSQPMVWIQAFSNRFTLSQLVTLTIVTFLFKNIAGIGLAHYQNRFVKRVALALTEDLYERFFRQRWTDYIQSNSAETARRIRITPAEFANNVLQGFLLVLTDSSICVVMLLAIAFVDIGMATAVVMLGATLIFTFVFLRRNMFAAADRSFRELTPASSILLTQGIDSFAEVRIYNKEEYFLRRFMDLRTITADYLMKLKTLTTVPGRVFEVVGVLLLSITLVYASYYPEASARVSLLIGLVSVAVYRILPALNRILINVVQIRTFGYSVAELEQSFAQAASEEPARPRPLNFQRGFGLRDISFGYSGAAFLFQHLNLSLTKGDFLVLEGPSGAGKTTLLHLLAGLLSDYAGEFTVDETVLFPSMLPDWQQRLGFVPQNPVVLEDTVLKNVAFGDMAIDKDRVHRALSMALLDDFLLTSPNGVDTLIGENGLTVSGGQRQRLVLARAFYRAPEVYLLDEVTNQLDEKNKLALLSILKKETSLGKIVVLISHDPSVRPFATHCLHLDGGILSPS